MLTRTFNVEACRFASAVAAGALAGGLAFAGLELPVAVAGGLAGSVAAATFVSVNQISRDVQFTTIRSRYLHES